MICLGQFLAMVRAIDIQEPFETKKEQTRHTTRSKVAMCAGTIVVGSTVGCYADAGSLSSRTQPLYEMDFRADGTADTKGFLHEERIWGWNDVTQDYLKTPDDFPVNEYELQEKRPKMAERGAKEFLFTLRYNRYSKSVEAGNFYSFNARPGHPSKPLEPTPDSPYPRKSMLVNVDETICKDDVLVRGLFDLDAVKSLVYEITKAMAMTQADGRELAKVPRDKRFVALRSEKAEACVSAAFILFKLVVEVLELNGRTYGLMEGHESIADVEDLLGAKKHKQDPQFFQITDDPGDRKYRAVEKLGEETAGPLVSNPWDHGTRQLFEAKKQGDLIWFRRFLEISETYSRIRGREDINTEMAAFASRLNPKKLKGIAKAGAMEFQSKFPAVDPKKVAMNAFARRVAAAFWSTLGFQTA